MEKKDRQGFYFFRRKLVFPSLFSCPLLRRNRSRGRRETGELRAEIRGEPVQAKEKKTKSSFFPSLLPSEVCVLFSSFFARLALALLCSSASLLFLSLSLSRGPLSFSLRDVVFSCSERCAALASQGVSGGRAQRPGEQRRRRRMVRVFFFFSFASSSFAPRFFLCPSAATTDSDKHRLPAARSSFHCLCYPRVSVKRLILMTSRSRKKE